MNIDRYAGSLLPPAVVAVLQSLKARGFGVKATGAASKTINVYNPQGDRVGYVNQQVINRGAFGYSFSSRYDSQWKDANSVQQEASSFIEDFCAKYDCQPSDLDVHVGTHDHQYLVIRSPEVALRVVLRDARMQGADEVTVVLASGGVYREASVREVAMTVKERNPRARRDCLEHFGFVCRACSEDLRAVYSGLDIGIVHVHHLDPMADAAGERDVRGKDLRPVCPNCHAVIHSRTPPMTVNMVRGMRGLPAIREVDWTFPGWQEAVRVDDPEVSTPPIVR
jgi:hypothetical protein